jgi:hypothetical protein
MDTCQFIKTILWHSPYISKANYIETILIRYLGKLNSALTINGVKTYDVNNDKFLDLISENPTFKIDGDPGLRSLLPIILTNLREFNDVIEKDQLDINELIPLITIGIDHHIRNTFINKMKILTRVMKFPEEGKVYNIDTDEWVHRNLDCDIICSNDTRKINEFTRAYTALTKLENIVNTIHLQKYNDKIKEEYKNIKNEHPGLVEIVELTFPEEDHISKVVEYVPTFSKIIKRRGLIVSIFDLDSGNEILGPENEAPNLTSSNPQKTLVYNQLYRNYYKWEQLRLRRDFTYEEVKYLLRLPEDFNDFTEVLLKNKHHYSQFEKFTNMIEGSITKCEKEIDTSIIDTSFWIETLLWNDPNVHLVPFIKDAFSKIKNRPSNFHQYDIKNDKWIQGPKWDEPLIAGGNMSENEFYNTLYKQYLLVVDEIYRVGHKIIVNTVLKE